MNSLSFEKIVDKLESKYEAVVRMSIKSRQMADGDRPEGMDAEAKITTMALSEYLKEYHPEEVKEQLVGDEEKQQV